MLDSCLYTAPGRHGGGGAGTTWLVGSPDEVAAALRKYADLGIDHFILSDTPYREETARPDRPPEQLMWALQFVGEGQPRALPAAPGRRLLPAGRPMS
ncbi:hypothetical protein [Actinoplanes sp. NPDC051411]|uniref:hypothetical protein n=1 Tax=Actinoplanes sp. NPDC051411 TaxID=3155522 RepID=UPI003434A837